MFSFENLWNFLLITEYKASKNFELWKFEMTKESMITINEEKLKLIKLQFWRIAHISDPGIEVKERF